MEIKLIDFGLTPGHNPLRVHENDAGADVYMPYDCTLQPGEIVKVPLGFGLILPDGYAGFVFPRSSMAEKELTCELPPVDSGYRGEGANIKLSGTVSDINGKSARSILEYLLTGKAIDGAKYDEMYEQKIIAHNLKATKEQIVDDLNGVMSPLQRRMMKELLVHLDELDIHIKNLDDEIDNFMKPEEKQASQAIQDVTGIGNTSAQAIISVIGSDMNRFPTDRHISSWAGLCPGDNERAKKRKSGKTRKGNTLLRTTLITCAHAAVKNKKSYFYAQYMRISAHRGPKRAYVAVAHSMLISIYHILKDGVVFKDLGSDYYNQFNKERKIKAYLKKLKALGWEVPVTAA